VDGNDLIARVLKAEGVEWMACFPNNPLIEAVAKIGIRPIAFRHERGAIMAADGFSRTSDRGGFGVVAVQSQAGAENSLGAIAQSFADNIPILALPGGVNLNQIAVRPNYTAVRNWGGITKRVEAVYRADDIVAIMRRAFASLRNGAPGPVVVELTADVCAEEVAENRFDRYVSPERARQAPHPAAAARAAEQLLGAKRPMLWAGAGVLFADATAELAELAELTATPVFTTMPGKSAFDERHPLALGAGGMTTTGPAREWLNTCDVLMALGTSLTRSPYGQRIPSQAYLVHNCENADEIGKDESVHLPLPGDAKLALQALIDEVRSRLDEPRDPTAVRAEIAQVRAGWMADWEPLLSSDEEPLNTYRVIAEIDRGLDRERSIVTHDAGAPRDSIVPFYTATTPHSYVGWGKTTHLGFGIPLLIGAKLAHPDRFCLNLMGDGAFGMSGTDIETAVRAGTAITTVLLNNGGMATYPGGFPTARLEYGVSHMGGDYAKIAEGMGATGITVRTPSEMTEAIAEAQKLNAGGTTVLIDVHSNMEERRSRL